MMARIRVLVVDDSVVVRRIVATVIGEDPELEVVGTAANGRIALQKLTQVTPDLITMDVEMPEMSGIEALIAIRRERPHLPVIMFSTLTERGAAATLDALAAGASDYVTKPANVGSVGLAQQRIRDTLIPKIKALCPAAGAAPTRMPVVAPAPVPAARLDAAGARIDAVAIGVSTGGPNALAVLLPQIPADFPVPILVVQHMPPMFTRLLAERLDAQSSLTITEAIGGDVLRPGHVYIAPGDHHLAVEWTRHGVVTVLHQGPPENSCRPAVDVLFRSVSALFGRTVLGVVLTGMGQDGLRGSEALAQGGARVIVQDEASSVVWGMPGFVARAGLADRVLPLPDIAGEIVRRAGARSARLSLTGVLG
jgi:two-component system chemotaxis response regulator CheB